MDSPTPIYSRLFDSTQLDRTSGDMTRVDARQSITAQASREVDSLNRQNDIDFSHLWLNGIFIIPLVGWCLLIASLLTTLFKSNKAAQTSVLQRSGQSLVNQKQKHLIPCNKCRYFSSNAYVRCAVHPSRAMTPEAIDCSDYSVSSPK
jgi:hypothetical protein